MVLYKGYTKLSLKMMFGAILDIWKRWYGKLYIDVSPHLSTGDRNVDESKNISPSLLPPSQ